MSGSSAKYSTFFSTSFNQSYPRMGICQTPTPPPTNHIVTTDTTPIKSPAVITRVFRDALKIVGPQRSKPWIRRRRPLAVHRQNSIPKMWLANTILDGSPTRLINWAENYKADEPSQRNPLRKRAFVCCWDQNKRIERIRMPTLNSRAEKKIRNLRFFNSKSCTTTNTKRSKQFLWRLYLDQNTPPASINY